MVVMRSIGILSWAKVQAAVMAVLGFLQGLLFTVFGGFFGGAELGGFGAAFGLLAVVVLPVLYGAFGFIGGAIVAFLYNLVAGRVGGIEFEFEEQ